MTNKELEKKVDELEEDIEEFKAKIEFMISEFKNRKNKENSFTEEFKKYMQ